MSLQVAHGTIDPNKKQIPAVKYECFKTGGGDAYVLLENPRGSPITGSSKEIASRIFKDAVNVRQNGESQPEFVNLKFIGTDR